MKNYLAVLHISIIRSEGTYNFISAFVKKSCLYSLTIAGGYV
ncbi:hypothetical protein [Chlorogloea sp. CCALA 695]|nr:hypothetical protein [Chlorogloea sp. CCALA 695]